MTLEFYKQKKFCTWAVQPHSTSSYIKTSVAVRKEVPTKKWEVEKPTFSRSTCKREHGLRPGDSRCQPEKNGPNLCITCLLVKKVMKPQ